MNAAQQVVLGLSALQALLDRLKGRGYRVLGPTVRDQAILYDDICAISDLPVGWTDVQDGGHYRLTRRDDAAIFGYAVGPHSWKKFLHQPAIRLWSAKHEHEQIRVTGETEAKAPLAFIGVRACELQAIAIQDKVLLGGTYVDAPYRTQREGVFVVAVNCSVAGGTCFCASMHTGPKANAGFDLALTELLDSDDHRFLVETGTELGHELLMEVPHRAATQAEIDAAQAIIARTAASMGRKMQADDVRDLLMRNLQHPRWDHVAERCLTCGNCTMVCPTCFCTTVEESSDLTGTETSLWRRWDSCFTMDFSYIHGGSVRSSAHSRYRQWMTHKLATWVDQFGSSGCVGCGRCITWCPVGIDITEEVQAIRESEPQ
jgi:ferredoxin